MQWFLPVPGGVRPVTTSVTCACSKVRRELEMLEEKMMRQVLRLQAIHGAEKALMIHWTLRFLLGLNPTVSEGPGALLVYNGLPWFTQLQRLLMPPENLRGAK